MPMQADAGFAGERLAPLLRRIAAERLTAVIGPTFSVTSTGTTK